MDLMSNLWAVHREDGNCAEWVGWGPSPAAAEELAQKLRTRKGQTERDGVKYWVMQMTKAEVEDWRELGAIPMDAGKKQP